MSDQVDYSIAWIGADAQRSNFERQRDTLPALLINARNVFVLTSLRNNPRARLGAIMAATLVCLLAWTVFILHVDYEGMRLDEDYTWQLGRTDPLSIIRTLTVDDTHAPLHYIWVWAWIRYTASEELLVMRLSSILPALLAVAMCYRLATDWFGSRWAGVGAGVFLGVSGIFVFYSTNLRMYSSIVLLVTVNWWFLIRLLRGKPRSLVWYTLTLILMAYTYYFAAFVIGAQVVVTLLFYRKKFPKVVLAGLVTLAVFMPWLLSFIGQIGIARAQTANPDAPVIGKHLGTVTTSAKSIEEFFQYYSAGQPAFMFILVALALLLGARMAGQYRRGLVAALLWFFLTITIFWVVNLVIPVYGLRYSLTIIPALALLAGIVVHQMPDNRVRMGMLAIVAVVGLVTIPDGLQPATVPNREMFKFLNDNYVSGDRIWYNMTAGARGSTVLDAWPQYHRRRSAPDISTDWYVWDAPEEFVDPAITPRVWDARPYWIPLPDWAASELTDGRVNSELHTFGGYAIRLYEAPPPEQQPAVLGDLLEVRVGPLDRSTYRPGETVVSKVWWRAAQPLDRDYSYTFLVHDAAGNVVHQADDTLRVGGEPSEDGLIAAYGKSTAGWTPDAGYNLATPYYAVPGNLPAGEYTLWVGAYYWEDPVRFPIEAAGDLTVDENASLVQVGAFTVAP